MQAGFECFIAVSMLGVIVFTVRGNYRNRARLLLPVMTGFWAEDVSAECSVSGRMY